MSRFFNSFFYRCALMERPMIHDEPTAGRQFWEKILDHPTGQHFCVYEARKQKTNLYDSYHMGSRLDDFSP